MTIQHGYQDIYSSLEPYPTCDPSQSDETSPPGYTHHGQASLNISQNHDSGSNGLNTMGHETNSFEVPYVDKPLPPLPNSYENRPPGGFDTQFRTDGRVQISVHEHFSRSLPASYYEPVQEVAIDPTGFRDAPRMNVNIMIVGSRGDVQPYVALGQKLRQYGHTVRIATHATFRDPHELMSYMVRNPGLIPGFESLRNGDIAKKQKMVAESCFERDDLQDGAGLFAADAIISNPPTFAHIHCAEALGVPLLLPFTMPWCATTSFPHPLVNIKQNSGSRRDLVNYYSYCLVDMMTWQGHGHTINKFRMQRLGLPHLNTQSAVTMIERCAVPWTYCLSPALVPKPEDWMSHIAGKYTPPPDLINFISAGEPPIYIGFGSIVLDNPQQITRTVLSGVTLAGVRAIISPGWGGLDKDMIESAGPNVFALGSVPHDWLFEQVSAVCHHGGAGTTAIGLRCGKPTVIVPFFGDQPWWAAQIASRRAGPPPIHPKQLTAESFAAAIKIVLSPQTLEAATMLGHVIKREDNNISILGPREYNTHMPTSDPIIGVLSPSFKVLSEIGRGLAKLPTSRPDKGVQKLLEASTFGSQAIIQGVAEGLHNTPKLYGSEVRTLGKALACGVYDGLVDLVNEPMKGIRQN
ncbi:hypothetical protein FRC07_006864, partial [Ceratobasidium sp. 392]